MYIYYFGLINMKELIVRKNLDQHSFPLKVNG